MTTPVFIFELLVNIFQGTLCIVFTSLYLSSNKSKAFKIISASIASAVLAGAITIMNLITPFEQLFAMLYIIIVFVYALIALNGKIIEKLFASVFPVFLILTTTVCLGNLFAVTFGKNFFDIIACHNMMHILVVIFVQGAILILAFASLSLLKKSHMNKAIYASSELLLISPVFILSLVSSSILTVISISTDVHSTRIQAFICILCVAAVNVFIFIISLEKNPETTQPESIPPVTIPKKTEPDKFSEQNYEMLRKIKHDINDTKQTIYTLMLSNDYDSVLSQLEGIESGLIKPDTYIKTENSVFNAVINSKFTFANQLGIKTTVATGSTLSSIDDFDLSRLLSNLIDNAIEACIASSSNNKHISVIIAEDSDKYTVTVKNTIDGPVLKKNPFLRTTKKDRKNHGLGSAIINDIAEKYNGYILRFDDDETFTCTAILVKS